MRLVTKKLSWGFAQNQEETPAPLTALPRQGCQILLLEATGLCKAQAHPCSDSDKVEFAGHRLGCLFYSPHSCLALGIAKDADNFGIPHLPASLMLLVKIIPRGAEKQQGDQSLAWGTAA